MKSILGILILVMVLGFARYPIYPIEGEISSIRIEFVDAEFKKRTVLLEDDLAINQLKEACGRQWYHIFPLLSNEGHPSYLLTIVFEDGTSTELYVDQDEVGMASNKNSKIYLYLNGHYG